MVSVTEYINTNNTYCKPWPKSLTKINSKLKIKVRGSIKYLSILLIEDGCVFVCVCPENCRENEGQAVCQRHVWNLGGDTALHDL